MSSFRYLSSKNAALVLKGLESLLDLEELCDVILRTEDGFSISAHRNVLSVGSPYFRAMFLGQLKESRREDITLKGVTGEALRCIVRFVYTSSIDVNDANVDDVLSASDLFQMKEITTVCCQFLKEQLRPSNCLGIAAIAGGFSCEELWSEARKFAVKHFNEVIKCDEFKDLSLDAVKDLLSDENVCIRSEEDVYNAAVEWLTCFGDRLKYSSEILRCVRLPVLSPTFLRSQVMSNEWVINDPECKQMLDEALSYASSPSSEKRKHSSAVRMRPRVHSGFADVMVAIGGLHLGSPVASGEQYNMYTDEWSPIEDMPTLRYGVAVTQLHGQIYCLGGFESGKYLSTVEAYDPEENSWVIRPPMLVSRKYFGATSLGGKIFAFGGSNSHHRLKSVECFDPYENQWTFVSPMLCPRMYLAVGTLGGLVYAVGGHDGLSRLSSVECYDPQSDEWSYVAPLGKPRSVAGVAALGGLLYVIGGFDGNNYLRNVDVYDPETNSWTAACPLNEQRSATSVAVMKGRIFAIGGFNGQFLSSVEVYDPEINQWSYINNMSIPRVHFGATVV